MTNLSIHKSYFHSYVQVAKHPIHISHKMKEETNWEKFLLPKVEMNGVCRVAPRITNPELQIPGVQTKIQACTLVSQACKL